MSKVTIEVILCFPREALDKFSKELKDLIYANAIDVNGDSSHGVTFTLTRGGHKLVNAKVKEFWVDEDKALEDNNEGD